ncbi:cardiolipin synthase [Planococcus salinus]|uniref:Cardiolipin synthase n=1 Tax=Planococcus salinus TaxID=1848460 RepID=A0A3M8P9G9_9BACL|nr:cardiolipin synthase [Planococcus salinus]RNF39900.1 cardiolipin synthase [Planococcus salinus]
MAISFDWLPTFQWWNTFSNILFILNIILAFFILFYERKRASSVWAWVLILFFLPVIGFVLYLFFGKPLSRNKMKHQSAYNNPELQKLSEEQLRKIDEGTFHHASSVAEEWLDIIRMNAASGEAVTYTQNNQLHIFTDGKLKFEKLFKDIELAQDHVHLQYFIIKNDDIGKRLVKLLEQKAREGIKVLLLYDDLGSRSLPNHFFDGLFQASGKALPSLPSKLPFINLRVNYRNHRKIGIVDGKIGYIGGFNVGNEYLGKNRKFGYWRDTHLRIEGEAVHSLQHLFLIEWNQNAKKYPVRYNDRYFPSVTTKNTTGMQIVASGPNASVDQIKNVFLKLITRARKSIYIQTPYFIPDSSILDAIKTAILGGVDVRIMVPNKADHPFVHASSLSFLNELLSVGAKVYSYNNGFLHAKTLVIDEKAFTIGSANMDVRSFSLNFEANAVIYNQETAAEMARIFLQDMELSKELTKELFESQSLYQKVKQRLSRLIAPIL